MDIEKIRTLIALMEESELVNLEISSDDEHISLTRHYDAPAPTMMKPPIHMWWVNSDTCVG